MKNQYILFEIILTLFLINGCNQKNPEEEYFKNNNETIFQEICEIGKEYEHTSIARVSCKSPEGYYFEVIFLGWGPCPNKEMRDCPTSVLKCVKEEN